MREAIVTSVFTCGDGERHLLVLEAHDGEAAERGHLDAVDVREEERGQSGYSAVTTQDRLLVRRL